MNKVKSKVEEFWYMNGEWVVSVIFLSTWSCGCIWLYHTLVNYFNGIFG